MIAPSIWNDAGVNDVKLADAPGVETRFWEQFLKHAVIPDLDIPAPHTQSSHVAGSGQSAGIAVMKNPADACGLAVNTLDIQQLYVGVGVEHSDADLQGVRMRPTDGRTSFADP